MDALNTCDVRFIDSEEWDEAMELVYRTFLEFDAVSFAKEGIDQFRDFIADNALKRMFLSGGFQVIGAYDHMKLVGVIALRDNSHISLLFIDRDYQNHGLGRKLVLQLADFAYLKLHQHFLTVNAAPYAIDFYHRIGFKDTALEITEHGIRYTPMVYQLD